MKCVYPLPPGPEVIRVDAGFLDPRYPTWRRQMGMPPDHHPGVDMNIVGTSGDGDLGYPVVAILPGEVVHARRHKVWGNVVLVRHYPHVAQYYELPELWSQYAHLHFVCVREGQQVMAGMPVGSIGKGEGMRAHLHFELRRRELPADFWPGTNLSLIHAAYLNPVTFLEKHAQYRERLLFREGRVWGGAENGRRVVSPRIVVHGDRVDIGI